jgi:hypothetical protein
MLREHGRGGSEDGGWVLGYFYGKKSAYLIASGLVTRSHPLPAFSFAIYNGKYCKSMAEPRYEVDGWLWGHGSGCLRKTYL